MDLKAGRCRLIVSGTALADFACVIELLDNADPQRFGFLSGPVDQLKAAQIAKRVQVDFGHGDTVDIRILQVSDTGIALIRARGGHTSVASET
jgi:hypothetical protein